MRTVEPISELKRICQEPKAADKSYRYYSILHLDERVIYRRISIYVTKLFLMIGISANETSLLGLLIGIIGGSFLLFTGPKAWVFGAFLLYVRNLLDCVDGEVARYNESRSSRPINQSFMGAFLESTSGIIWRWALVCMSISIYRFFDDAIPLILGLMQLLFLHIYTWCGVEPYHVFYVMRNPQAIREIDEKPRKDNILKVNELGDQIITLVQFLGDLIITYGILVVGVIDCFVPLFLLRNIPLMGSLHLNARYLYIILITVIGVAGAILRVYYTTKGGLKLPKF